MQILNGKLTHNLVILHLRIHFWFWKIRWHLQQKMLYLKSGIKRQLLKLLLSLISNFMLEIIRNAFFKRILILHPILEKMFFLFKSWNLKLKQMLQLLMRGYNGLFKRQFILYILHLSLLMDLIYFQHLIEVIYILIYLNMKHLLDFNLLIILDQNFI